jgi:hypothetical protein
MNTLTKSAAVALAASTILLAGCTSAEVSQALTSACSALGAGASAVAVVSGVLPGGAVVSSTISTLISDVSANCPAFASDVAAAIGDITNLGASADVTVSPSVATSSKMATRFGAAGAVHFTVKPDGSVVMSPAMAERLRH